MCLNRIIVCECDLWERPPVRWKPVLRPPAAISLHITSLYLSPSPYLSFQPISAFHIVWKFDFMDGVQLYLTMA